MKSRKKEAKQIQQYHYYSSHPQPEAAELEAPEAEPPRRSKWRVVKRVFLILIAMVLVTSLWLGWGLYRDAAQLTGNNNPMQVATMFLPANLENTNGRTNILVAGFSADDPGHGGAQLTDSIMILSIDPAKHDAAIISVPRDLYVNVPDLGYSKINAAYQSGEDFNQDGYAPGGMGLLAKTLKQTLGVDIHYYGLVNYQALKSAVDTVGGVQINVQSDDPRGIYDPATKVKLPNGVSTIDGTTALNISRSRGAFGGYGFAQSDFDRTKLQQAIALGLKDKAEPTSLLTNPFKVSRLVSALGDNAKTNMNLREIQTLYRKTKAIDNSSIKTYNLNDIDDVNYLMSYRTKDGQSALIPAEGLNNYTAIRTKLNELLYGTTSTQ
jgi:LCP family protein required for cell wall assembly